MLPYKLKNAAADVVSLSLASNKSTASWVRGTRTPYSQNNKTRVPNLPDNLYYSFTFSLFASFKIMLEKKSI